MAELKFKRGSINYSEELQANILVFARKLASVMLGLNESDARIVAFALDPNMDSYILRYWNKREIIQEAIETMVARNYDPKELDAYNKECLYQMADSILSGLY